VPCEAVEEFGVFGHASHVNLKKGKALLKRGELLKELFLSELRFGETAFVFVVSVDKTFHDDAPLCGVGPESRREPWFALYDKPSFARIDRSIITASYQARRSRVYDRPTGRHDQDTGI